MSSSKYSYIEKCMIEEAVRNDKNGNIEIIDWELKNFLKAGDNIATYVTSIIVKGSTDGVPFEETYVVKLNPGNKVEGWDDCYSDLFGHEEFYLNFIRGFIKDNLKFSYDVNVPQVLFSSTEKGKEILIFKDLRKENFKMYDRKISLDMEHLSVILTELAKLHAAGFICLQKHPDLQESYPILAKDILVLEPSGKRPSQDMVQNIYGSQLNIVRALVSNSPDLEDIVKFIEDLIPTFYQKISDCITNCDPKFKSIIHGDLWTNNILVQYDDAFQCKKACLLDFQTCRLSTIAIDFLQLFFTSVSGSMRTSSLDKCMAIYYKELESILTKEEVRVPFSLEELIEEFRNKIVYGIVYGLAWGITTVLEGDQIILYNEIAAENISDHLDAKISDILQNLRKNPNFEDRLYGIVNDIREYMKN